MGRQGNVVQLRGYDQAQSIPADPRQCFSGIVVIRTEFQRPRIMIPGLLKILTNLIGHAQIVVGRGHPRIDFDGLSVVVNRLIHLLKLEMGSAEIVVDPGIPVFFLCCGRIVINGRFQLAEALENQSKAIIAVRMIRHLLEDSLVILDRGVGLFQDVV